MIPSISTTERKAQLRSEIRAQLTALPEDERRRQDSALFATFLSLPEVEHAQTVFLFYGVGIEPETARLLSPLLERGKRVVLPRLMPGRRMECRLYCPDKPLVPHRYGLLEPSTECPLILVEEIDLALVPALCYDWQRYRLGLGGGYYDRWLSEFSGVTVGLCRDCLLRECVPVEPHDRQVDLVLTETLLFSRT